MAIDNAMGLIPCSTPLESQTVKMSVVDGATVYKGQIVKNVAGALNIHAVTTTSVDVVGVCLESATGVADLSVQVSVCVDPAMVYRVLSDGAAQQGDYGFFGEMASNSGSDVTGLSDGVIDDSSFVAAASASLFIQHLGPYDVVSDEANLWLKVRLTSTLFNDRFGLAS